MSRYDLALASALRAANVALLLAYCTSSRHVPKVIEYLKFRRDSVQELINLQARLRVGGIHE